MGNNQTIRLLRLLSLLLGGVVLFCGFPEKLIASPKLNVVCTFFPLYLFTKNVVGEQPNIAVELLLPPEMGCPHDYALTPGDVRKISRADILVVNGLGMESFIFSSNWKLPPKTRVVKAAEGGEAIRSRFVLRDTGHRHNNIYNPHLFASPRQALIYIRNIEKGLSLADPDRAKIYKNNAGRFLPRLIKLDRELKTVIDAVGNKKVVILHDSLEYLLRDIGLQVTEVIQSAKELSAREIIRLVRIIEKSRPAAIFTEPQYSTKAVEMLSRETGIPYYILDPVVSGSEPDPDYYEAAMRKNITVLKRALVPGTAFRK